MPAYADTYATTANDGPVILTIDGINEEDCEIDYTMDMDHSLDEEAINVVADVRNNSSITNDTTMDNLMAVDLQTGSQIFPSSLLVLDTNVLISKLDTLKSLHELLLKQTPAPFGIIIPDIVIRELDAQKDSSRSISKYSRAALSWCVDCARSRTSLVKFERSSLINAENDDRILGCASDLQTRAVVLLLTNDKSLVIKAESLGIQTMSTSDDEMRHLRGIAGDNSLNASRHSC